MTVSAIHTLPARQKRLMLTEPELGWSRDAYERELRVYVAERGRGPQTVTMHPTTADALALGEDQGERAADGADPLLITSLDHDRQIIVWYF
jgi:hypothetical protein